MACLSVIRSGLKGVIMWNDFINAKSILPGEVGIINPTNTNRSRGIQVIAYSSNFKEYIVFPSIKEACQLFNRLGKNSDPKLLRKYYIDTGRWYKENHNWKMTTEIPEKWFQEKGFKLVNKYTATFNISKKTGEAYSYRFYPEKEELVIPERS